MDAAAWWIIVTLCVGMVVVIGGILVLRLHAFLALTLGALAVAVLTPPQAVEDYLILKSATRIQSVLFVAAEQINKQLPFTSDAGTVVETSSRFKLGRSGTVVRRDGSSFRVIAGPAFSRAATRPPDGTYSPDAEFVEFQFLDDPANGPQAGDLLIESHQLDAARSAAKKTIASRVADGFGGTASQIGILIAMASIIGKCLLDSGAADRVVRTVLGWFGERFAPLSFVLSGFLLGVPVFFDTVFYLMIPLGKAMHLRTGRNYLLFVLTIVAGATMAHSLVPPTPGPLVVADQLGVDLGVMILAGTIVGLFTAGSGYLYAAWFANRRWTLPLRDSAEFSLKDLEALSNRDESELPPFWLSVLPIILPVILIAGYSVIQVLDVELSPDVASLAETLGDKNIALILAAVIAMLTLIWSRKLTRQQLSDSIGASLASGGIIILITSAGGAFGQVLQQTGVASLITELPQSSPAMIITLAFLITTAIRTAQGSATVAMMTAVGILGGLAESGGLPFHPVYLALAIGCGSKPIAWMNDSGFWVITRMSGMTEAEGLKFVTPMTTLMGVVGLIVTLVGATLFPLV